MSNNTESELIVRLHKHISEMSPRRKDREAGKLLVEAAAEIVRLKSVLELANFAMGNAAKKLEWVRN